ncbi:MAG: LptF/LptG family permease [Nitrospiraceae bacterium]|nr:LptF/LptG family permease [Nitrospiraceae bacterium]
MNLLKRLYVKEFANAVAVVLAGLSLMLGSVDLIEAMNKIHGGGAGTYIKYLIFALPQYIVYTMPVAGLFAGLFVIGQAVRNRETIAVMSAGGRTRTLFLPLVAMGLVLTAASFLLAEFVAPPAMQQIKIMTGEAGPSIEREGAIWLRADDGSLVRFYLYQKDTRSARQVEIFQFNRKQELAARIDADGGAVYNGSGWMLKKTRTYDLLAGTVADAPQMTIEHLITPGILDKQVRAPEEMSITELYDYTKRLREAGIRNLKLTVDMNSKLSYPLVNFFMVLFAVALATRRGMGGLAAASLGIAVSLVYWFGYTMCLSFGYAGVLPPLVAAWSVPALFAAVSLALFKTIRE